MLLLWFSYITIFLITTSKCEPPVNSYLPPTTGSGSRPSNQYGAPNVDQGRSFGRLNPGGFGSQSQSDSNYNALGSPSNSPSPQYGVPEQGSSGFSRGSSRGRGQGPNQQYIAPGQQYGAPDQQGPSGAKNSFGARGSSQKPDTSYGVPSSGYKPGNFNGRNSGQGSRQQFGGSPSSSYGTPDFGNNQNNNNLNYRGSGVDDSNEPAKYEFSYEVDDAETGTKFGHSERRDGDVATGEYNVVLPDGRKQVVEYEADQDGYKPQIRYEGTGGRSGSGFGNGGSSGRNQGYSGASADAGGFAGTGYPQSGSGHSRQQPGFGSGTDGGGYPGNTQGYPSDGVGGSNGFSNAPGGRGRGPQGGGNNYPGVQGNRGPQGGSDGYPSGGPSGQRGSGY